MSSAAETVADERKAIEGSKCEACNKSELTCARCTKLSTELNQTEIYRDEKLRDVSAERFTDPSNRASHVKSTEELQFNSDKNHVECHYSLEIELFNSSRTKMDACGISLEGKACTNSGEKDEASNHSHDVKGISVDRRKVARLNDDIYWHAYRNSISVAMKDKLKADENAEIKILCLCGELSLLPLFIPVTGLHHFVIITDLLTSAYCPRKLLRL